MATRSPRPSHSLDPLTMQFGGAPRCAKCGKAAYAAEQVMGPARQIYHKPCLVCTTCSRRLDALSLVEHDSQPFCKRCHAMQFGTRDLRSGNVYEGDKGYARSTGGASDSPRRVMGDGFDSSRGSLDVDRSISSVRDGPGGFEAGPSSRSGPSDLAPFRVTARKPLPTPPTSSASSSSHTQMPITTTANPTHLTSVPSTLNPSTTSISTFTSPTAYAFSSPPISSPRPPPTTEKKGVGVYRASPAVGSSADKDACEGCGKRVYFAEQVIALSHKWHRGCLRCTSCRNTVDPGRVADREGRPYCKNCYGKEFGPIGLLGKR